MRPWIIGGLTGGVLGVWFYFAKVLTNYYNTKLWMDMNPTVNSHYLMYALPDIGMSLLLVISLIIIGCILGWLLGYPIERIRVWRFKKKWRIARGI